MEEQPTTPTLLVKRKRGRPTRREVDLSYVQEAVKQAQVKHVSNSRQKHIPIEDIINLRAQGYTYDEIGAKLGCSNANVCKRLEPWDEELRSLPFYQHNRSSIFDILEAKIAFSFNNDDFKKASFRDKFIALGILRDKSKDLQQVNVNIFNQIIQAADAPMAKPGPQDVVSEAIETEFSTVEA